MMTRTTQREFRTRKSDAALWLVLALLSFALVSSLTASEKPNVILILADDMAPGDLSSVNEGLTSTPRLDLLAKESLSFSQAYAASPVCAPSRAALLTGRYPHRTGAVTLNQHKHPELARLKLDETTLADRFRANGFVTGIVGKWHSGLGEEYDPRRRGFDESVIFHDATEVKTYFKYQLDHNGEVRHYEGDDYLTDVLTQHAIDFVQRHKDEPFFLHLAHYAPHRPLSAPQEVIDRYLAKGCDEKIAKVYAMIEIMDTGIGVLLDELEQLAIAENTIVIFASDNGPDPLVGERFNAPLYGAKYMVNEGGIRVPFFIRWPKQIEPRIESAAIHFIDVTPTLIEVCGLSEGPAGRPIDGVSFAGLLGEDYSSYKVPAQRFWQWNRLHPDLTHNAAVRQGDWKLVRPFVTKNYPQGQSDLPFRLHNLAKDPGEKNDLAEGNPQLVDQLAKDLESWFTEIEADRKRP